VILIVSEGEREDIVKALKDWKRILWPVTVVIVVRVVVVVEEHHVPDRKVQRDHRVVVEGAVPEVVPLVVEEAAQEIVLGIGKIKEHYDLPCRKLEMDMIMLVQDAINWCKNIFSYDVGVFDSY